MAKRTQANEGALCSREDAAHAVSLAERLLPWFVQHSRELPWRIHRTAYRVWVSEVMLQQTRVATVIPYFERFMARFPTLQTLAEADLTEVLALWSGLGYYRRARALHQGAQEVMARFGGHVPHTVRELRTLRGVGAYTAGAIASLAFGIRAPLVDGNVARVFARLFGIQEDIRLGTTQKRIWALAEYAVPSDAPGAFNEALMELGAMVCLPREPRCLVCPLALSCEARRSGTQAVVPVLSQSKAPNIVYAAALVARKGSTVLLGQRRGDALFGGLWEPPMIEAEALQAAQKAVRSLAPNAETMGSLIHKLSHRTMHVAVMHGEPGSQALYPALYEDIRYVAETDLPRYGVSSLARKILVADRGEAGPSKRTTARTLRRSRSTKGP